MKGIYILSAVLGAVFAIIAYLFCGTFLPNDKATQILLAILVGTLTTLLLSATITIIVKREQRKYNEIEKTFKSKYFYKANGNFYLGTGTRNGNIYFFDEGIVFVSIEKPVAVEEILLNDIEKYEIGIGRLNVHAKDGRLYCIAVPNTEELVKELRNKNWIIN